MALEYYTEIISCLMLSRFKE